MKNLLLCCAILLAIFCNGVQGTKCSPLCGTGVYTHAGTCQPSGRCLCFWGWTGPNAQYTTMNRILADYCRIPCHYTPDYKNPQCVDSNHTGGECKVPTSTTPTKPCDPKCGNPPYHGRGQCLSDGRCLCWWGWTGPGGCYVEDGKYKNRIIADYCFAPCHYTPYVRNPKCLNGSWDGGAIKTTEKPTEIQTTKVPCDPLCGTGVYTHAGSCLSDGRCLCAYGWTGPHAQYTASNRILADYCRVPCHYTHDYENPECVNSNHTGGECKVPSPLAPTTTCDPRCGKPPYYGKGTCLSNGRCLCWWGWTGPNACYVEAGSYKNRLIADYCVTACHYTPVVRNATCLNSTWPPEKKTNAIVQPLLHDIAPIMKKVKCDPKCGTGVYTHAGTCQDDGRCLCFWGWTGPNAKYTTNNKVLADYCRIPCHYTHDYANPQCVNSNHTGDECVLPSSCEPKLPCDRRCGNPPNHGKGLCLSNGRCLCWWGWTGPHACYIEKGYFRNRIMADYCERPCHYTYAVRNATCLNLKWKEIELTAKREIIAREDENKSLNDILHV